MSHWIAVGDETGNWDRVDADQGVLGVCLVLGRWSDWQAAFKEFIGADRVSTRLGRPLQALPTGAKRSSHHHALDALGFWQSQGLRGEWTLDDPADDPLRREVFAALGWLARHSRLLTIGLWGRAETVWERLHRGQDPALALGQAYGRLASIPAPFLRDGDRLSIAPAPRSEPPDLAAKARASRSTRAQPEMAGPMAALGALKSVTAQDSHRVDGDLRATLSALQDTVRTGLACWPPPRPEVDVGMLTHVLAAKKDTTPQTIPVMNAIADLGAALMRLSPEIGGTLRLRREAGEWPNVRFFRFDEVLP